MRFAKSRAISLAFALVCLGWLAVGPAAAQEMDASCYGGECQPGCYGEDACMPPECGGECPCSPIWSVTAEALVLQRTPTRSRVLFDPTQASETSLDARNMNLSVGGGYLLDVIRHDICGCDWEFAYFQADGFSTEAGLLGTSHMRTEVNGSGFFVTDALARYNSQLYSGELNMRRKWSDAFTFLAGFRMGQLNEQYRAIGADASSALITDSLSAATANHLYGFQLGADMNVYDMGGPLLINLLGKAGIYGNNAHLNYVQMVDNNGTITTFDHAGVEKNQASFLGEAGAVATYALTKRLAFHASAKAMWVTGVALAPEQIEAVDLRTGHYSVNTSGAAFYYGGGMGLEYRY